MKISLTTIIDYILKFALLFFINLIWCFYFVKPAWLAFVITIASSLFLLFIFSKLESRKKIKKHIKLKELQSIKDITNTFIFMPQDQILEFFCNLANTKHKAKIIDNFVVIGEKSFTILSPHFNNDGLNCDKLIETYNQISKMFAQNIEFNNIKKIIICTNKNKENVDFVVDNFCLSTIILDAKQTYLQLLKAYEFYPKITVQEKPKAKNTFKKLLAIAFDKKRTKSYVLSALFMFFASFFVFYKIYYLIVATLLLSFAILCQTNLPFNKVEKEKLIE